MLLRIWHKKCNIQYQGLKRFTNLPPAETTHKQGEEK